MRDKDAIFVRTWRLPEEVIDAGVNLKVIARQGKEMTNIPVEYATKKGIAVVNAAIRTLCRWLSTISPL